MGEDTPQFTFTFKLGHI